MGKREKFLAILLSVLFISGCSRTPDYELTSTDERSASSTDTVPSTEFTNSTEVTSSSTQSVKTESIVVRNTNSTQSRREDLSVYNLNYFTEKFWQGDTVYHDSICFAEQADGTATSGTLLYAPNTILNVSSCDLKTTYTENKDFTVEGNRLVLTKDSRIKVFPRSKYCTDYNGEASNTWLRIVGTDKRLLSTPDLMSYQIVVTYTHADSWKGFKPETQTNKLPKTSAKFQNKEALKIVFYGDSITAGWDAGGQNEKVIDVSTIKEITAVANRAPFTPAWAEMVTQKLKITYGYDGITKINRAAAGSTSNWGRQNAGTLVNPQNPDLVVIAFGMNEALNSKDSFQSAISGILNTIHAGCPNAEFLLVSCMMPNRDSVTFAKNNFKSQEEALYALQSARSDLSIGVVPVHSMFLSLHEQGKQYTDYSSNNINHPNDFAVRIYAQMVLHALGA